VQIALLVGAGAVAGVINTLAGGGSLLSVPLLVSLGLPGDVANGTNRIGVLSQNLTAMASFRRDGIGGLRPALPVLLPTCVGSVAGAQLVSLLPPLDFERLFGIVMLLLLYPTLRVSSGAPKRPTRPWPPCVRWIVFFAIGLYGGALQAGVGLFLIFAMARAGYDLVTANAIKVVIIGALTLVAVPVFIMRGQVEWWAAGFLVVGFGLGGILGARLAVAGGERIVRPVLAVAVLALAGRMLSLY